MHNGFKRLRVVCTRNSVHAATGQAQCNYSPIVRVIREEQCSDLGTAARKKCACIQGIPAIIAAAH
jgi:hypothetical protein